VASLTCGLFRLSSLPLPTSPEHHGELQRVTILARHSSRKLEMLSDPRMTFNLPSRSLPHSTTVCSVCLSADAAVVAVHCIPTSEESASTARRCAEMGSDVTSIVSALGSSPDRGLTAVGRALLATVTAWSRSLTASSPPRSSHRRATRTPHKGPLEETRKGASLEETRKGASLEETRKSASLEETRKSISPSTGCGLQESASPLKRRSSSSSMSRKPSSVPPPTLPPNKAPSAMRSKWKELVSAAEKQLAKAKEDAAKAEADRAEAAKCLERARFKAAALLKRAKAEAKEIVEQARADAEQRSLAIMELESTVDRKLATVMQKGAERGRRDARSAELEVIRKEERELAQQTVKREQDRLRLAETALEERARAVGEQEKMLDARELELRKRERDAETTLVTATKEQTVARQLVRLANKTRKQGLLEATEALEKIQQETARLEELQAQCIREDGSVPLEESDALSESDDGVDLAATMTHHTMAERLAQHAEQAGFASKRVSAADVYRQKIMQIVASSAQADTEPEEEGAEEAESTALCDSIDQWRDEYGREVPQEWVQWVQDNAARGVDDESLRQTLIQHGLCPP
jgi:hypothetical protein